MCYLSSRCLYGSGSPLMATGTLKPENRSLLVWLCLSEYSAGGLNPEKPHRTLEGAPETAVWTIYSLTSLPTVPHIYFSVCSLTFPISCCSKPFTRTHFSVRLIKDGCATSTTGRKWCVFAGHARGTARAQWNIAHSQDSCDNLTFWAGTGIPLPRCLPPAYTRKGEKTLISFNTCRKQRLAFHWFDCVRQGELSLFLHAAVTREELTFCSAVTSCSLKSFLKTQC